MLRVYKQVHSEVPALLEKSGRRFTGVPHQPGVGVASRAGCMVRCAEGREVEVHLPRGVCAVHKDRHGGELACIPRGPHYDQPGCFV